MQHAVLRLLAHPGRDRALAQHAHPVAVLRVNAGQEVLHVDGRLVTGAPHELAHPT